MMKPIYEIRHLRKMYKRDMKVANDDISFDVFPGEILSVLGPNGAGKSTLVKQMVAQSKPTSGTIMLFDRDVTRHSREVAQRVGYYAQESWAMANLTVKEALSFTARFRGFNRLNAEHLTNEWLDRLELHALAGKMMKRISGGQRRLAGLASIMIGDPSVLILDEPTNELDPVKRKIVWDLVREKNRKLGTTILLVTHNVLEAEQVVDRVAIVNHGKLQVIDSIANLKKQLDPRLRVEITIQTGMRSEAEVILRDWGHVEIISENRLRMLVESNEIHAVVSHITEHINELYCTEYKIVPPSLEDVYLNLGGQSDECQS
jgi:ABC-2 type transport system ATP-binding protein